VRSAYDWEEDEVADEATFLATFERSIEDEMNNSARWRWRSLAQRRFLEANAMEFPKEFLIDWMVRTNKDTDAEKAREEYDGFARSLTWSLLVNKIAEENEEEVKVDPALLRERMIQSLRQQFMQMGQVLTPEQEEEYFQYMVQNQEVVDRQYQQLLDEKIFDFLETKFNPEKVSITATDFLELPSVAVELGDESPETETEEEATATD
jgi:trigger factor